jgi:uncharacterized membrane protein
MFLLFLLLLDSIYIWSQYPVFLKMYNNIQGELKVRYWSAALCYIFLGILLYHFILKPKKPVSEAFLLGLCVYGVYDSTNYALLKKYSLKVAIMDTLWGGTLFAIVTWLCNLTKY